jgi:hypothetical protein
MQDKDSIIAHLIQPLYRRSLEKGAGVNESQILYK